jgi:hypothetical protein
MTDSGHGVLVGDNGVALAASIPPGWMARLARYDTGLLWLALISGLALVLLTVGSMSAAEVLRQDQNASPAGKGANPSA